MKKNLPRASLHESFSTIRRFGQNKAPDKQTLLPRPVRHPTLSAKLREQWVEPATPSRNPRMGRSACFIALLLATSAVGPARGQHVVVPAPPGYAINPPGSDSPLQRQILGNYRSNLRQLQRELAAQNPSGLSRQQLDVMHQLNTVNSALSAAPARPAAPSVTAPLAAVVAPPVAAPFR
jgi:hypothetical protein